MQHQKAKTTAMVSPTSLIASLLVPLTVFRMTMANESSSGLACGSIKFNFVGERCVNATHFSSLSGNCTGGALLEDVKLQSCSAQTEGEGPYCHQCGSSLKDMVCSSSADSAEACAEQCQQTEYGYAFLDYCLSQSDWTSSETKCLYGSIEQVFATSASCAALDPDTTTCLDCGPFGICAEASATCDSFVLDGDSGMDSTSGCGYQRIGGILVISLFNLFAMC
jgi:hypothetical protein